MRHIFFILFAFWLFGGLATGQSSDVVRSFNTVSILKSGTQTGVNIKAPSGIAASFDFTLPTAIPATANSPIVLSVAGVASYGIPLPTSAGTSGQLFQTNGTSGVLTTATYPGTAGTNGTILRSNGTNWVNTSAVYPTSTTVNRILYSSATNTIDEILTTNNATLVTNASGVPSVSTTLPSTVQGNITTVGTITTATTFSNTTDSTSTSTGGGIFGGGVGILKALFVGGTTNQLGTPPSATTGYVGFSGNLYANATGTSDTQKKIIVSANTYNGTDGVARAGSLTGSQIEFSARASNTSGCVLFRVNGTADTVTTSPTLVGFLDCVGKWTIGQIGGIQQHAVNGDMLFTGGIGIAGGTTLLSYHDRGTFTTAVTGYASVNVTCSFQRTDKMVRVTCPSFTGTSNSTVLRIPLPAALQSGLNIDQEQITRSCTDNGGGNSAPGCLAFVPANGTYIDLRLNYSSGTTWTASGTKAFSGFTIGYLIL